MVLILDLNLLIIRCATRAHGHGLTPQQLNRNKSLAEPRPLEFEQAAQPAHTALRG